MKFILMYILVFTTLLSAETTDSTKENRAKKQLQIEMEKEKKYSKERTFYQQNNYDFKGAQVNPASIDSVPDIEIDDFDMDSVYD